MITKNIYENVPSSLPEELVSIILENKNVRVERIVSKGHTSPEDFWYDQDTNEYVLVLKGSARLVFENKKEPVILGSGDYMIISAHEKHRVAWTNPLQETIWLAVHYTA